MRDDAKLKLERERRRECALLVEKTVGAGWAARARAIDARNPYIYHARRYLTYVKVPGSPDTCVRALLFFFFSRPQFSRTTEARGSAPRAYDFQWR